MRPDASSTPQPPGAGSAGEGQLTRFVVLRLLGFVYLVAFASLAVQYRALLGSHGLTPAGRYLDAVQAAAGSRAHAFFELPTAFLFTGCDDRLMVGLAWAGAALSLAVTLGLTNAVVQALLWAAYLSFVHVGQHWYSFGWEMQLCETGFLAIFLCPLGELRPFPKRPPPRLVLILFGWLIARIMLGAGLIKLRGDACWRDLTCLIYHFETQPIPNPISRALHLMPPLVLRAGTLFNHVVELGCPPFLVAGRRLRHVAATLMLSFQVVLILSGNLAFLNWLTIVPILACFDDAALARVLPSRLVARARAPGHEPRPSKVHASAAWVLAAAVALLSVPVVLNLLSPGQAMNTSFEPFELVNTYGAFGSVGKERLQLVIEGTTSERPGIGAEWREYRWKAQPSDPRLRPPFLSPWHWRVDWLAWFAAMEEPSQHVWLLRLARRLLDADPLALSLLGSDPFDGAPPRYVRIELWRYRFAPWGAPGDVWWTRDRLGDWLPPVSRDDPRLARFLARHGGE